MADYFCDVAVPDWVAKECGVENGGVIALGLLDKDQNPTDTELQTASYWTTGLGVSPQYLWVIKPTRGEYPGGTPTEEEGFGKVPTRRTGADHEATVEAEGVVSNRDFWAGINKKSRLHAVLCVKGTSTAGIMLYARDVSVFAKINVQKSVKTTLVWQVSIKWNDDTSNPRVLTTPSGVFE